MTRGMSHPTRWARATTVAVATGLALLTGSGIGYASPVSPQNAPTPKIVGDQASASVEGGSYVFGDVEGDNRKLHTGQITLTFGEGAQDQGDLLTYCIDLNHPLSFRQPYTETEWADTGISAGNLANILWILGHSRPNVPDADVLAAAGVTDAGSNVPEIVYAGTQAAIWHYSDGLTLTPRTDETDYTVTQYDAIAAIYKYLTSAANTGQNGAPTLTITPPSANGLVGDLLGPFTVDTTAPSIALTASTGATLLGADKTTPVTSVGNGGQFWVKLAQAGSATVTGEGQGFVAEGRAFVVKGREQAPALKSVPDSAQKLIAAELTPQKVSAKVAVTATAPTTVAPTATPTTPPLANTGASPMPKVWLALLFLVLGTGLTLVARRRRGGSHA